LKILSLLFLLTVALFAKDSTMSIGAGLYSQTQPYKDAKALNLPTPVIFFDNSLLYVRWTRVGVYFMGNKSDDLSWGASLTALPRANRYDSTTTGVEDKKSTWEGGLSFGISKQKLYAELLVLHDILDIHNAYTGQLEIGYEYKVSDVTFYPSLSFFYQSAKFINYYYEPKDPKAGVNVAIQTYISYPLTKKVALFLNLKAEKLSKEITNSSLIDDNIVYSSLFSLIYTFHYN
jgi:outer membrane protein